jgi:hypothetical protein
MNYERTNNNRVPLLRRTVCIVNPPIPYLRPLRRARLGGRFPARPEASGDRPFARRHHETYRLVRPVDMALFILSALLYAVAIAILFV